MLVERAVSDQPFQSAVFFLQLAEPTQVTHAQMRILLLPGVERDVTHPGVPASACRMAYTTCSSENFDRFMGPLFSCETVKAVMLLSFQPAVVFRGDVTGSPATRCDPAAECGVVGGLHERYVVRQAAVPDIQHAG